MKESTTFKLKALNADFEEVTGKQFRHFFCPILFRDDPVELCDAHVVNKKFPNTSRTWTVQRKDVDGFFGSKFEADFVLISEINDQDLHAVLTDPVKYRRLRPVLSANGKVVNHYYSKKQIPDSHTGVIIQDSDLPKVKLALKLEPSEALALENANWEFSLEHDLRLVSLVSLLKAAHLSLFKMLGYRYVLSAGGYFLGWNVLGQFYVNHRTRNAKDDVIQAGIRHFNEFVNLVRPVQLAPSELAGSVNDGYLYICCGSPVAWALMVFIKTDKQLHAVLVPVLENAEAANRFVEFLRKDGTTKFSVRLAKLNGERWEVSKEPRTIEWPAAKFLDQIAD